MVPLLLDGERSELGYCPINTINRVAYEHIHRLRWSKYMRATIELLGLPRTCECAVSSEASNLD